jgi:hypothetical protein
MKIADALESYKAQTKGERIGRQVHLTGQGVSLAASFGLPLQAKVIPALRRELELEGLSLHTFSAGAVPEVEEDYTEYEEDVFIDDVHGEELSGGEVASARAEEVDWVKKREVVKIVPETDYEKDEHGDILDMRWVDTRKKSDLVRSRLVCREIKARAKLAKAGGLAPEGVLPAMPPVESLETLLAVWAAEGKDATGEDLRMGVWDFREPTSTARRGDPSTLSFLRNFINQGS